MALAVYTIAHPWAHVCAEHAETIAPDYQFDYEGDPVECVFCACERLGVEPVVVNPLGKPRPEE